MTTKTFYAFGFGAAEGDASMKNLLGGKGANLAEMAKLGVPVPPGVTIPTDACGTYQKAIPNAQQLLCTEYAKAVLAHYEKFIAPKMGFMPLLSVRSGARVSMPGMMDTILNVGITTENLPEWAERLGGRAALDSYRRLIQMYGCTVHGIPHEVFAEKLEGAKQAYGVSEDHELSAEQLKAVVADFHTVYSNETGEDFPDSVTEQLAGCIGAVFGSWNSERAIEYRIANKIPHDWGTAVTVQSMVFGNLNDESATGVLFTRDPNTGEPGLFGEFLVNAQGEDVVAGIRTPEPLKAMSVWNSETYVQLHNTAMAMEAHYGDMQDMEFTVQNGQLFVLQTRNGKRSAAAAFRIAYDLASAEKISWADAVKRVTGKQYMALKRPTIAHGFNVAPTVTGLPAAGAVVTGVAVMTAEAAKDSKVPCILVREETTPDDFGGMMASVGILTRTGGATSHAAVVARGMDKCCVVGASAMKIGHTIKAGDTVTIDGATGRVWVNVAVPVQAGGISKEAQYIADYARKMASSTEVVRVSLDKAQWQMQLPESGNVVLALGDLATSGRSVRMLLEELEERPGLSGVLDFHPEQGDTHAADSTLSAILGVMVTVSVTTSDYSKVIEKLVGKKWTKKLKARWSIKAPSEVSAAAEASGWSVGRKALQLGDLLKGGVVEVTPTLTAMLKNEGTSVDELLTLLSAAKKPVALMPKAVDEDTLMFAVLGK